MQKKLLFASEICVVQICFRSGSKQDRKQQLIFIIFTPVVVFITFKKLERPQYLSTSKSNKLRTHFLIDHLNIMCFTRKTYETA